MNERQSVTLVFGEKEGAINFSEFAEYLSYFRLVYGVAADLFPNEDFEHIREYPEKYITRIQEEIRGETSESIREKYLVSDLGENELYIEAISYESPLKIRLSNVLLSLLSLALIFSGGTVKAPGIELHLPPIAVGVEAMREALQQPKHDSGHIGAHHVGSDAESDTEQIE